MNTSQSLFSFDYNKKELILLFSKSIIVFLFALSFFYLKQVGLIIFLILAIVNLSNKKSNFELIVLLTLLFATNVFEFGSTQELPYLQLGAGLRLDTIDILFVISIIKFLRLEDLKKTPSIKMVNFLILISLIYVIIGFILTRSPKEAGFNYLRILMYPGFFYVFYHYFKDLNNIKRILIILSFWVILSSIIQITEFFQGYRFTLPGVKPFSDFYSTEGQKLLTAGIHIMYSWSRTTTFNFIMIGFGFAIYLSKGNKLFLVTALISTMSFAIATVRIFIIATFLMIFLLIIFYYKQKLNKFLILICSILLSIYIINLFSNQIINIDFIKIILGRIDSIITLGKTYGELDTLSIRLIFFNEILNKFLESPLWGWGFGIEIMNNYYSGDLGLPNRFLLFGLIGTIPLLLFIVFYILNLISIIKKTQLIDQKMLIIGLSTIIITHLALYLWQIDFYGSYNVITIMMLYAMGDRLLFDQKFNNALYTTKKLY